MSDNEFGIYINADDSTNSEDQEDDNVEILVCSVLPEGEIADMDELSAVGINLSNAYRVEVDDIEFTVIVDLDANALAGEDTADLDVDANKAIGEETADEQSNGYTGNEGEPVIATEKCQDTDYQLRVNPDVCFRECHYTRWRKHHPFKHEWEVSYVCNICSESLVESALASHMKIHCQQFVDCKPCGSKICKNGGNNENVEKYTCASDSPYSLNNMMTRDVTENSNVREPNKENSVLSTERQSVNKEKFKMTPQSAKENLRPEINSNTENEIEPLKTNFETEFSNIKTDYSKANNDTKQSEINPEITYDTKIENLKVAPKAKESMISRPVIDHKADRVELAEAVVDMAEEIKQLMEENTRKWGPLTEIKVNRSAETSVHTIQQLEVTQNAFSNENIIPINCGKFSYEAEIPKIITLDRQLLGNKDNKHTTATNVCKVCKKSYSTVGNLKRHSVMIHDESYLYTCDVCGQKFDRKPCLTRHLKNHFKIGYVSCKICSREFPRNDSLYRHMTTVHSNPRYGSCKVCSKAFLRKDSLYRHMTAHSNQKFKSPGSAKKCDALVNVKKTQKTSLHAKMVRTTSFCSKKPRQACLNTESQRNIRQNVKRDRKAQLSRDKLDRHQRENYKHLVDHKHVIVRHNKPGVVNMQRRNPGDKVTDKGNSTNREMKLISRHVEKAADKHRLDKRDHTDKVSRSRRRVERQLHAVYGQQCCGICK